MAFSFSAVLFAVGAFLSGIYAVTRGWGLSLYVKKNRHTRWIDLSSIGDPSKKMGSGGYDSLRAIRYIYNDLDNDDHKINDLKKSLRISIKLMGFFLVGIVLSIALIIVFHLVRKS